MRTIAIGPARVADLGVLCELYRQLNPGDPPWPSEAAALDALASVPRHAGTTILVCEVESMSSPARSSGASISRDRDAHLTLIENAVTHRDQRRQGYGRRVVQRAIEAARQQGCYRVSLMTGSRRQETLRAFMRRPECKRGAKTAFEARFVSDAFRPGIGAHDFVLSQGRVSRAQLASTC